VGALWALCQQEAMLGRTDWACALFTPAQLRLLEWVEDVEALVRMPRPIVIHWTNMQDEHKIS
jgi:hypothetical protein